MKAAAILGALSLVLVMAPASGALAAGRRMPVPAATSGDGVVEYQMPKGENLFSLARRALARQGDYRQVQRLNRIADPHRIPVGTVIRIPVPLLRSEPLAARIVALRGNVLLRQGDRTVEARPGTELAPGTTLATGADGFVTLQLPNGSRTSMPTQTRMRIVRLHRIILTGSVDYDLAVDKGKVETLASPLGADRNNRFRIRTPRAIAAVRGTRFRVGFDETTSLAEVIEGKVAANSQASGQVASLTPGLGAVITASGALATEALLPEPDLANPGRVQTDPQVRLVLKSLPGAGGYHVQIAEDAGFAKVIAEQQQRDEVFAFAGIPNGSLFVRVSALAASGLEGLPQTYAMRRILAGVRASAQVDGDSMRFDWGGEGEGQRRYSFQLGDARGDAPLLVNEAGLGGQGIRIGALGPGVYRWRVGVRQEVDGEVVENWLPFEKLTVAAPD